MESEREILEDGEIVDYTPLERPPLPITNNLNAPIGETSSDEVYSSDSEEDNHSEDGLPSSDPKRMKFTDKKSMCPNSLNKYNVWMAGLQEEALLETFTKCDVKDGDPQTRSIEEYNYRLKYSIDDNKKYQENYDKIQRFNIKRPYSDYKNKNRKFHNEHGNKDDELLLTLDSIIHKRGYDKFNINKNKKKRNRRKKIITNKKINDLSVSQTDSPENVAKDICNKLYEFKTRLISEIVNVIGNEKAMEIFYETKKIEDSGGMKIMTGKRRRTPGGVYFHLVKGDSTISSDKLKQIFHLNSTENSCSKRKRIHKKRKTKKSKFTSTQVEEPTQLSSAKEIEDDSEITRDEETSSPLSCAPNFNVPDNLTSNIQKAQETYENDFLELTVNDMDFELV